VQQRAFLARRRGHSDSVRAAFDPRRWAKNVLD
jgi:hypothetical protein